MEFWAAARREGAALSLARIYSDIGSLLIRKFGDAGGPPSARVSEELNNIINWAKNSPRRIGFNFSTVGNVGTGLDTLHTFTLPTNSLATNGDELESRFGGFYAANTNSKRLVFSVDGTQILNSSLLPMRDFGWWAKLWIGRVTATSINAEITLNYGQVLVSAAPALLGTTPGGVIVRHFNGQAVANLNSNGIIILVQGETDPGGTGASNDVNQNYSSHYLTQQ